MKRESTLNQVEKNVKNCTKCRLYKTAQNAVPGEGNIYSEMVFIGEAPGRYEDETGRPFVGRAGKLLETLLGEIGYKRSDVWIGNIIKHRPPENRDPLPDEIAACKPYLNLQLQVMAPLLIVTLGRFAMNYFYAEGKISKDRGKLIKTDMYNVYPVYHPAAALRSDSLLGDLREDFLGIPLIIEKIRNGQNQDTKSSGEIFSEDGQLGLGF